MAAMAAPPSMSTPIRNRLAMATRVCGQPRLSTMVVSGNSFFPTTPFVDRRIRTRCCSVFCRRRMRPRPTRRVGIDRPWNELRNPVPFALNAAGAPGQPGRPLTVIVTDLAQSRACERDRDELRRVVRLHPHQHRALATLVSVADGVA